MSLVGTRPPTPGRGGEFRPKPVAAELTPRQREVLALYMGRDMNVTQIAAVLGVNKSTVSRSLHRALRRLERCLRYSF